MGARLGANPQVFSQIGSLGLLALAIALAAVVGSIALLVPIKRLLPQQPETSKDQAGNSSAKDRYLVYMLTASVGVGIALGVFIVPQALLPMLDTATSWMLGLLLLAVGLDLGGSAHAFSHLKSCGLRALLVPLGIMVGSILGGLVVSLLWRGMVWNEMAAAASGFGWYSLSSVLITQIHSPALGAVAFLANIFRELLAIIITPLVARWLGPIPSLGPAGATSMDSLLPVIARGAGSEYVPLSFLSGAVLSLSVPVFVNGFLIITT